MLRFKFKKDICAALYVQSQLYHLTMVYQKGDLYNMEVSRKTQVGYMQIDV
jgi:hypothetical protein